MAFAKIDYWIKFISKSLKLINFWYFLLNRSMRTKQGFSIGSRSIYASHAYKSPDYDVSNEKKGLSSKR